MSFNLTDVYFRLPKGPRSILFREFLPIMKPLLDEMRDIARLRKKTVSQVVQGVLYLYSSTESVNVLRFTVAHIFSMA